jgi:orotate phosphoribosyltransferase
MRDQLLNLLRTKSLKRAPEGKPFILASGKESMVYLDVRKTALSPEGHNVLGYLLYQMAVGWTSVPDLVAGVALGGCPLASAVSMFSCSVTKPFPAVYVRKEAKGHGSQNLVEGPYEPGQNVLLLEDVVTTGGSSLKALEALREAGLNPVGVVGVVDREQGGAEAFAAAKIIFLSLVRMKEVLDG